MKRFPLLPVLLLLPLLTTGCFLNSRRLADENNMLQARVLQLRQDLEAIDAKARILEERYQEAVDTNAALAEERDSLKEELIAVRERLSTTQRVMSESQRSQAEALQQDLTDRLQRENEMKLRIDELGAELETTQNAKALLESELESLKGTREKLDEATADLEKLAKAAESYRAERDDARAERDDFRRQIQAAQSDQQEVAAQLEEVSSSLRDREKELAAAQRQLQEAEDKLASLDQQTKRADQIRRGLAEKLTTVLAPFVESGDAKLVSDENDLRVRILSDSLFTPGTVLLSDDGVKILEAVAGVLKGAEYSRLEIIGHTDNVPVKNMPFVDNWDLAASRAASVTRWFSAQKSIPSGKLIAESRAFFDPIAPNENPAGRRQNRRVEIRIVP
ncbi:OmpA family protein [bacterium]|nr:OmpA family protein [bacterium]